MIFEKVTWKLLVETEKTSSGTGSRLKKKSAECGKVGLPEGSFRVSALPAWTVQHHPQPWTKRGALAWVAFAKEAITVIQTFPPGCPALCGVVLLDEFALSHMNLCVVEMGPLQFSNLLLHCDPWGTRG